VAAEIEREPFPARALLRDGGARLRNISRSREDDLAQLPEPARVDGRSLDRRLVVAESELV